MNLKRHVAVCLLACFIILAPGEPDEEDQPSESSTDPKDRTSQIVVDINVDFLQDESNGDLTGSYVIVARAGHMRSSTCTSKKVFHSM